MLWGHATTFGKPFDELFKVMRKEFDEFIFVNFALKTLNKVK